MMRFWSSALLLIASIAGASAMERASTPPKFPVAWGASAGSAYVRSIPVPSQIGIQNCAASLTDGFPPLTFVPAAAGGCAPLGQDFNGILRQLSQWSQWGQAGGPVFYDSAFATAIGGYPKGALLTTAGYSSGTRWISLVDNNLADPDADETNWAQDPSQIPYGTPVQSLSSTVRFGYLPANGLTVGTAASNATGLADGVPGNSQAYLLFVHIWRNFPGNAIFTSGGTPTSRGASAPLDFAANKAIATPVMKGLGLMGADTMAGAPSTFLAGVPVSSGSATVPGSVVGENLHVLAAGEAPTITSSNGSQSVSVSGTTSVSGTVSVTGSTSGTVSVTGSTSGTVSVTGDVSGSVSVSGSTSGTVSGDVGAGGRLIPTSSGAISSLQAPGTGTINIVPANLNGNWSGTPTLSGSMSGTFPGSMSGPNTLSGSMSGSNTLSGSMSGSNTLSGSMSGSNTMSGSNSMSGPNSIGVTSNNTGGAGHNTAQRGMIVYWNLKL